MTEEPLPQTPQPNPEAWFYAEGQKQIGPFDRETMGTMISAHEIRQETFVWKKGMPQWLPLHSSPLTDLIPDDMPPPLTLQATHVPPQPVAPKPVQKVYPLQPLRSSAWIWWGLIAPGFPQIIFGQPEKALVLSAGAFLIIGLTAGIGFLVVMPLAIVDAMMVRATVVRRGWVGKWDWFPS